LKPSSAASPQAISAVGPSDAAFALASGFVPWTRNCAVPVGVGMVVGQPERGQAQRLKEKSGGLFRGGGDSSDIASIF